MREDMAALCATEGLPGPKPCKSKLTRVRAAESREVREYAFALALHAESDETLHAFEQAYSSIRLYHPGHSIVVVDNASPKPLAARVMDFLRDKPDTLYIREAPSGYETGAYGAAVEAARFRQWDVRGWVFLQATMVLLRPLPLGSPPCKLTSFLQNMNITVACDLPEFDKSSYNAFRIDVAPSIDDNYQDALRDMEFRRLKHEFPFWKQAERRVCGREVPSAMHQSFIVTAEGLTGLQESGYFSVHGVEKEHSSFMERFNGVFLAALDSENASCFIDEGRGTSGSMMDTSTGGGVGTFVYKQHGSAGGWGQGFFAAFLSLINAVDANGDTVVDDWELERARSRRPAELAQALGGWCAAWAESDPFEKALGCQ